MTSRTVLLVVHGGRGDAIDVAGELIDLLRTRGLTVSMLAGEAQEAKLADVVESIALDDVAACELVLVVGGDGTLLRAVEASRIAGVPVLGINLGHMGFLAEAEREDAATVVDAIVERNYTIEQRMCLDVVVCEDGREVARDWALNEASVEKAQRERMIEVLLEIDGRPLSRWGCDGVVCATPTGSTAYAFSAGGPIVWPEVEALLCVPLSAHALFARPLVVGPSSRLAIEIDPQTDGATLFCDGRRLTDLKSGARVEVTRSETPARLARLHRGLFTDRLVAKFDLPVEGWRGVPRSRQR